MEGTATIKQKKLFNLYWITEVIIAAVSLVNLLVIRTEHPRAAEILNLIFLIITPLIFALGYADYKNFDPLTPKKEFLYCAAGTISLWITLIRFNVRNYNVVYTDFLTDPFYNEWVSALAALFFAVGIICAILCVLNRTDRKRLDIYFYSATATSLLASLFLVIFNYSSQVSILNSPLRLSYIAEPVILDLAAVLLTLRALTEQCIYIARCRPGMKAGTSAGKDSFFKMPLYVCACVAVVFITVNMFVPRILVTEGIIHDAVRMKWIRAALITETVSSGIVLICGLVMAFLYVRDERYSGLYLRIGLSAVALALAFILGDVIPINAIFPPVDDVAAQLAAEIYGSVMRMVCLLAFALYAGLSRKVNGCIRRLEEEREEKYSPENYSI